MNSTEHVRVRFAPSPTGFLHIGGLRTALFNYLIARRSGGAFILRLEDTDRSRYVEEAEKDIFDSLRWTGIEWDEGPDVGGAYGPYVQSERLETYTEYGRQLEESGLAYRCYCTSERLAEMRKEQEAAGTATRYDRHCLNLSPEERESLQASGQPSVLRFRIPDQEETVFNDYLRGEIRIDNRQLDDFILIKSDGFPTYHFANVLDDHLMEISHVLRGEEWISSTPRHVLLYQAFGWDWPEFVHLPVIRSPQGGKLSKRDGATNVREFRDRGYLPEAMVNFLALLGWSYDGERSMFRMEDLEELFSLEKVGLAAPVFDTAKLDDYNGKYIRELSLDELFAQTLPFMQDAGLVPPGDTDAEAYFTKILPHLQERLQLLAEVVPRSEFFFRETLEYPPLAKMLPKKTDAALLANILKDSEHRIRELDAFDEASLETALRAQVEESGLKVGQIFMGLRMALTASRVSPGLFETMAVLGRDACLKRLQAAREHVEKNG